MIQFQLEHMENLRCLLPMHFLLSSLSSFVSFSAFLPSSLLSSYSPSSFPFFTLPHFSLLPFLFLFSLSEFLHLSTRDIIDLS